MIAEDRRGPDRGARFLILAASLVVVLAGLRAAGQLLLPFLVSVLLAIISLPLMAWLRRKGAPTVLAVLATVLTAVAVLAGVVIVVGRSLNEFTAAAPDYQARFQQLMGWALEWFEARGVETAGWGAPAILNPGALMDLVGGTLRAVAAIAQNTFLVILTMVFILAEAAGFWKTQGGIRRSLRPLRTVWQNDSPDPALFGDQDANQLGNRNFGRAVGFGAGTRISAPVGTGRVHL